VSRTAAALVIGDEILTGKVQEQNVAHLGHALFRIGIRLRKVVVCPDDVDEIVGELNAMRAQFDHVFTSGGVGPTHDDVTIRAVARAFDVEVTRSPEMERLIRAHFAEATTEAHLRLADVPAGASLVRNAEVPWPTVHLGNVFVLPGVPEIFRMKLGVLRELLGREGEGRFISRAVYADSDEWDLAPILDRLVQEHPGVAIGSYPRFRGGDYKVKLTFDGTDPGTVDKAADALVAALPPERIIRRD
jgi:molybdenum cofactor synthesis domain-containing protein